ncbi:MAG: acyl-CoA dehydrogenase family protein [Actinomycetota bacterium]|nr:acyl-CoA/acyl-ACP dehydrogenase [Actinomycetota bacterium]
MEFDFTPEQYTLRDEARRFLEAQCPPSHVREFIDDETGWSRDLWKRMADLGWMGLAFPEDLGGLGQSFGDVTLLLGELGRAVAPVPFLASLCAGQVVFRHGSVEQQRRWLPSVASGERIATIVIVTPDAAVVNASASGDGWVLKGETGPILDAPAADMFVVAAHDGEGARWFVAEEGVRVTPQLGFDRTRTIGRVAFDGAAAEPLSVGGLEPGSRVAVAAVCAEMVGVAQKILDTTVEYSKVREQFGRPIGSFQAIKHKCAEMLTELEASRSAAFYAGWSVDGDADDAALAVAVAKSYCSEALAHLAGEGVQIHGGIAFTWEHDMHLYLRRIKSDEALFGDAAFHRERIARLAGL